MSIITTIKRHYKQKAEAQAASLSAAIDAMEKAEVGAFSVEAQKMIVKHGSWKQRTTLAKREDLDIETQHMLRRDPDWGVVEALAEYGAQDKDVQNKLAKHTAHSVRAALARNENLDYDLKLKLAKDKELLVWGEIATRDDCDDKIDAVIDRYQNRESVASFRLYKKLEARNQSVEPS